MCLGSGTRRTYYFAVCPGSGTRRTTHYLAVSNSLSRSSTRSVDTLSQSLPPRAPRRRPAAAAGRRVLLPRRRRPVVRVGLGLSLGPRLRLRARLLAGPLTARRRRRPLGGSLWRRFGRCCFRLIGGGGRGAAEAHVAHGASLLLEASRTFYLQLQPETRCAEELLLCDPLSALLPLLSSPYVYLRQRRLVSLLSAAVYWSGLRMELGKYLSPSLCPNLSHLPSASLSTY